MSSYVSFEDRHGPDQWDAVLAALAECDRIEREMFSASISMVEDTRKALEEAGR